MPRQQTMNEVRLENFSKCITITVNTLNVLVNTLKIPGLEAMVNTTQSLLKFVQTIKQDKNECAELMEQTHNILNAIIGVYVKSDTGIELPPSTLNEIANFTQTLHRIYTFIEAQQSGSKVKKFFRQGELNGLLKDCKTGLQEGIKFFQIKSSDIMSTAREMEEQAQIKHQEVLNTIETISSSDSASSISRMYSGSYASSNSISMLPAEPKIFHGCESELADILNHFRESTPRIAILGAGGMGKTSLAQTVLHHEEIMMKYQGNRLFVVCDTAASKVELAGLIGAHLGMKPGKDLTRALLYHLSEGSPTLLILDNLETVWEPVESRKEVEEFLSLLTDIASLALMSKITMRGTERPSKVQWTRPFLPPPEPLAQEAARKVFIDIAEDRHPMAEINQVLSLTDNMPLSINLLAHAVDVEGCTPILSRWQREHTSVISDGYDQRSNLESSILLSLESPRITSTPHSQELLSLLSILPDGLSDPVAGKSNIFNAYNITGSTCSLLAAPPSTPISALPISALPISAPPTVALGPRASSFRVQYLRTCRSVENENGGRPGMFANWYDIMHRDELAPYCGVYHQCKIFIQTRQKRTLRGRQLNAARRKQHVLVSYRPEESIHHGTRPLEGAMRVPAYWQRGRGRRGDGGRKQKRDALANIRHKRVIRADAAGEKLKSTWTVKWAGAGTCEEKGLERNSREMLKFT
ncbi:hypothetical protein B0H16DRAFT_1690851 [Mycena metata]|uniref:Novel STAND NTPase 1 domain-containing protein n=1 Tax=Mycena metata TaxID=1033252 RepID=A0AAD7IYI5_9AGAR|nr:hypothetical protein B0H16DRAFT_1690851 [Mycena metata]